MIKLEVFLKNAAEIDDLNRRIKEQAQKIDLQQKDIFRLKEYAERYLVLVDQLQRARKIMNENGLDTSFIKI